MERFSARRYLRQGVRLHYWEADALLDAAARTGKASWLWDEENCHPDVTDVRVTVTVHGDHRGWQVHRPGFEHRYGGYYYLDDGHSVDCERCYCLHYRWDLRSGMLRGEPPSTCRCGHYAMRHHYRRVRDVIEVCRDPDSWFTEDMRTFNALANL